MSNTLFRKGLVAAAIAGLAATAFAGTPAFAVAGVSLAPTTGTGNTVLAGGAFSLTATSSSEVPSSSYGTLKFKVTNVDGVAASAHTVGAYDGASTPANVDVASTPITATAAASIVLAPVGNVRNNVAVVIDTTTAATTAHYTVDAFLDANANGAVDAGELVGTQTVTFLKAADVTATTTITAPVYTNAQTVNATTVITTAGWNTTQASVPSIAFTDGQGHTIAAAAATTYSSANSNYGFASAKKNAYDYTIGGSALAGYMIPKGTIISAQASLASTSVGAAATTTVVDSSVATLTGSLVAGNTASGTSVAVNSAFQAQVIAYDASTPAVALAGKTVAYSVTVVGSNFLATKAAYDAAVAAHALNASNVAPATVTVNGVVYTNQQALPGYVGTVNIAKLSGVTDANGKIVVSVSSTGLSAGTDSITLNYSSENATGSSVANQTAQSFTATITNLNAAAETAVAAGASSTISVQVVDQFGNALADTSDLRVRLTNATPATNTATSVAATQANAVIVPIVAGKATATVTDNGTGAGRVNTYAVEYIKRDAALGGYGSNVAASVGTVVVDIKSAADLTAGVVLLSGGATLIDSTVAGKYAVTAGSLSTAANAAYDGRNALTAAPSSFTTALGAGQGITATVSSTTTPSYLGTSVAGQAVTFALAGAEFKATLPGGDVYATDSITIPASAVGVASVVVYSNLSGAKTVTVTSGAASATVVVTFPQPAAAAGASVVIAAPATALPGTTIKVVATVVDKFGNTVQTVAHSNGSLALTPSYKLVVSGIGAGFTHDTTGNVFDLTAGTETNYITLGASDTGTLTITATFDVDGSTAANAAVTKTATVVVAQPSAAKTAVAVGASQAQVGAAVDVTATATDAAGKPAAGVVVSFTVAGQGYLSTATATTNAAGVATVKLVSNVAGMNTVSAAANGSAAATTAVTFGNADANLSFSKSKHSAIVNFEFAGNAKVVVSVNGARVKTVYPADDMVGSIKVSLKKGKNKVTVSVAGVVTDARTVTTK